MFGQLRRMMALVKNKSSLKASKNKHHQLRSLKNAVLYTIQPSMSSCYYSNKTVKQEIVAENDSLLTSIRLFVVKRHHQLYERMVDHCLAASSIREPPFNQESVVSAAFEKSVNVGNKLKDAKKIGSDELTNRSVS